MIYTDTSPYNLCRSCSWGIC